MADSIKYRPEIDGLRSVAVLAVILFHVEPSALPGGYLGVDVFFVISGFLITSIICRELAQGEFTLLKFWDRRIKRILPAASVLILVTSIIRLALIFRPDLMEQTGQKLASLLSIGNFYFWISAGDYWGRAAESSPYLHFWSLSVEEQYYIFYPLILTFVFFRFRKNLNIIFTIAILSSLGLFLYGSRAFPSATFYLLPTRIWELGSGCLLALALNSNKGTKLTSFWTCAGLALIALAYFLPEAETGIGLEAVLAVLGACLVIASGENAFSKKILMNRWILFIGMISYSLYLWHWPILVTLRELKEYGIIESKAGMGLIALVSLICLSLLSYYCIEKPFRKMQSGTPVTLTMAFLVGLFVWQIEPLFHLKQYKSHFHKPTWYGLHYDSNPHRELEPAFQAIANSVLTPSEQVYDSAYIQGGLIRMRKSPVPEVVLIGDSHAVMLARLVEQITHELDRSVSIWAMNGEPALTAVPAEKSGPSYYLNEEERFQYDSMRLKYLSQWHPKLVILAARWEGIDPDQAADFFTFLEAHAENVLIVESPPPLIKLYNRSVHQFAAFLGRKGLFKSGDNFFWTTVDFERVEKVRDTWMEAISEKQSFSFLQIADIFALESGVMVGNKNTMFYLDDDHLTEEGALLIADRFKSTLQKLLSVQ